MTERTRINVLNNYGRVGGWFVLEAATRYLEAREYTDGFTERSVNTGTEHAHETLYRTAKGQWVLNRWSDYEDSGDTYHFVPEDTAKAWLLLNKQDDAVDEHFGELEDEAGPNLGGRPSIGPRVETRLPADVLDRVTAYAAGRDRADALRDLIVAGLNAQTTN